MHRILSTLILLSALTSCATLEKIHQDWLRENCNKNAASRLGLKEGLTPGYTPNDSQFNGCPDHANELKLVYLQSYAEGAKSRPQEIKNTINISAKEDQKNF